MSVVAQVTTADILRFVSEVYKKYGPEPNVSHYLDLLRECLGRVFRATRAFDTSWSNASGGDLTLDGNEVALPIACQEVTRVEWDGSDNPLEITDEATLDAEEPGWRDATGEPSRCAITGRRLFLNSTPSDATGKLVMRGFGVPADNVALTYLPADLQMAPTKFMLRELFDPAKENEMGPYEKYGREWAEVEPRILEALRARARRPFTYP
jgi:hypothetical protein